MRKGEILNLQWRDVSLARSEITVRAEHAKDRELRRFPISPRLRAVLELIRLDPKERPHPPEYHVFGNLVGEKVGDFKKGWQTAVLRAHGHEPVWEKPTHKLAPASQAEYHRIDLHFHDLRHEAGSRLLQRGMPLHGVQLMLGHADAKTTSVYLNASLQELHTWMARFPEQSLHQVAQPEKSELPPPSNAVADAATKALVN